MKVTVTTGLPKLHVIPVAVREALHLAGLNREDLRDSWSATLYAVLATRYPEDTFEVFVMDKHEGRTQVAAEPINLLWTDSLRDAVLAAGAGWGAAITTLGNALRRGRR